MHIHICMYIQTTTYYIVVILEVKRSEGSLQQAVHRRQSNLPQQITVSRCNPDGALHGHHEREREREQQDSTPV